MLIHFARHGETDFNAKKRHQLPNTQLSFLGIKQAKSLAHLVKTMKIDVIISSPYTRAKETAEIIAEKIGADIIFSSLFRERKRPSIIEGKLGNDKDVIIVKQIIENNFHNPDFIHSDEENFIALKKRARDAINYILNIQQENILVVTHGDFIKILSACLLFGEDFTSYEYLKIKNLAINNCSLVSWEKKDIGWHLVQWNRYSLK